MARRDALASAMNEFLDTALLGIGAGAIYGMIAQGLIVVYRGSGVLNFAQGAFVMVGAYLFYQFSVILMWPIAVSIIVTVLVLALVGAAVHLLIMYPMRNSSRAVTSNCDARSAVGSRGAGLHQVRISATQCALFPANFYLETGQWRVYRK